MELPFLDRLRSLGAVGCDTDHPASRLTTFRIGGAVRYAIYPERVAVIPRLLRLIVESGIPFRIVGGGSNILACDEGFDGAWLLTRRCSSVTFHGAYAEADCGLMLHTLIERAAALGLGGLENLYGIPGTVGGAAVMNAGAYGVSFADAVTAVTVYDLWRGAIISLPFDRCAFGYRTSLFQNGRYVILRVALRFTSSREDLIRGAMQATVSRRAASQPLDLPSAGSVFRRPVGAFAARLIEEAGLSGYQIGNAAVSEKHCGFFVNLGGAAARDVRALVTHVQECVRQTSGVYLIPEIIME